MTATMHLARRSDPTIRPIAPVRGAVRSPRFDTPGRPVAVGAANFAVRRAVAAVLLVLVVAFGAFVVSAVAGALGDVGSRPAAASSIAESSAVAPIVRLHVAQPGDTLWSIADQYRGEVGRSRFVDALIDVNDGTAIQVGQAVRLP